ncbi:putative Secreted Protein [Cryptosporidium tyzzeri]|nr:putative Secreted Protein [Cryptosporidium tyzzeri]
MKPYVLFLILVLNILLFGLPIVVESSSFKRPGSYEVSQLKGRSSSASSVDSKKSGNGKGGFLNKLFGFFGRNNGGKKDKVSKESNLGIENYSAQLDNYEVDSESSESNIIVNKHSDFSPSSLNESSDLGHNVDESQQEKEMISEESKSAPAPVAEHFADESSSDPKSESMKDGFISIYDEDYDEILNKRAIPDIVSEESGKSSEYVGGEEQKSAVPEQSEVEKSNEEDVLRSSDSQILGEKSLQEGLPESVDLNEGSRSSIAKDVENEDSVKHKPSMVSGEENHYDASYESNLEEMEKSVSEYRAKFSEDFSDELPHETYDRLLNDALKHEASTSSNNQEKIKNVSEYSGSEHSEKSKTSQKEEASGIEKYLEDTADDSKEGSEASTADLEDRTTITLDKGMPKYPSQDAATEEEPEDLEEFLANTYIKVPEVSELSIKNDKSPRVPTEYIREKSRTVTEPLQMQEQESGSEKEFKQESEGEPEQDTEKESEREFDKSKETSSKIEESSKPSEKSTGIISRISDTFKNFISSFGGSKKESEVTNEEEFVSVPAEESQKAAVESSVEEESEKPEELPDNNKSRVKMLIEHFEKENARNVPAPIGVPRNRLGLRNTEGSSEKKNIDSLINFFENEDIKAKEEAKKYKESIKKREMSRAEGSVRQLEQIPEENLEVQLESINVEESPESGEEREAEIMRAINGEQPSEISRADSEGSDFTQTSNFDESQGELSVPIAIPNIYEEGKLAGGLAWALGVGKYVCNSKSAFSSLISPPLSKNLLVSAPSQEQTAKLLRLSGGEASDIIMDLVSSVLAQN